MHPCAGFISQLKTCRVNVAPTHTKKNHPMQLKLVYICHETTSMAALIKTMLHPFCPGGLGAARGYEVKSTVT
jgi:hypothetical protein